MFCHSAAMFFANSARRTLSGESHQTRALRQVLSRLRNEPVHISESHPIMPFGAAAEWFHVVVGEEVIPEVFGTEYASAACRRHDLPIVLLRGYSGRILA
jgi:hypothetical protein